MSLSDKVSMMEGSPTDLNSEMDPSALPAKTSKPADGQVDDEEEDEEAAGEDRGLDYRLLSKINKKNEIFIPKRGEKDFEPLELGVNVQERALRESRGAMFAALRGVRGGTNKTISHAHLSLPTASDPKPLPYTILIRGNHFNTIGHTYRPPKVPGSEMKPPARTVLLPEEALYLLERGSLFIWRGDIPSDAEERAKERDLAKGNGIGLVEEVFTELGARRMTVQEGWALWGQDVTEGRYNVYASLKRLGYVVHRAPQHMPSHLLPPPAYVPPVVPPSLARQAFHQVGLGLSFVRSTAWSVWNQLGRSWTAFWTRIDRLRHKRLEGEDRWKPLIEQRSTCQFEFYSDVFSHLRIFSAPREQRAVTQGGNPVESTTDLGLKEPNPYDVYYHVWKPSGQYKKREPGEPDFKIGVIDAQTLPLPSHNAFQEIFSTLPLLGPPKLRYPPRNPRPIPASSELIKEPTFLSRLAISLGLLKPVRTETKARGMLTNAFPSLKQGDKAFVLAVVDGGGTLSAANIIILRGNTRASRQVPFQCMPINLADGVMTMNGDPAPAIRAGRAEKLPWLISKEFSRASTFLQLMRDLVKWFVRSGLVI
ncbi:Predicted tRNA-splicing endonuclease subunit [Phaffia rhodozyma]|uniref:Predicted tRNA-splicing endonuclease subunit n=1 Tax=Phaffia rhodozyma TaxID=264483 RepID=A0A0F7SIW3_PHARH|nr:Predicted tRNA-splicing endonuclease subunit [Phaffia rhodozyma]